jgi:hypothetical protein
MMILARRVTGRLIRFYPTRLPQRSAVAWEFAPNPFCSLVRQELSGAGYCAIGKTVSEARQTLIEAELLNA